MNELPSTEETPQRPPRAQRQLAPWKRVVLAIVAPLIALLLKTVWALFRFDVRGDEKFRELVARDRPVVIVFWHEGLLTICWYVAGLLAIGYKATFLISPSADGEIGVQILARFGSRAVRGSARRSGAAALRGLKKAIQESGQSPCITLDGSKGPRRYCKPGAIMVARMSDVPIVPIGFAAQRCWRAHTWDRHVIPKPFSRVVIAVGDPYTVPRDMDSDAVERWRSGLEQHVNDLMAAAESSVRESSSSDAAARGQTREE